jgi:hypothetical protein
VITRDAGGGLDREEHVVAERSRINGRSEAADAGAESPGRRYLQIVAPVNEVVGMFNQATDDSVKGGIIQALSVVITEATAEIEDVVWPAEAQEAVDRLVAAANTASAAAGSLIADLTDESAAVFASEVDAMADASSHMRSVLGLPVPGAPPAKSTQYTFA